MSSTDEIYVPKPTVQSLIGAYGNQIIGALLWLTIFVAVLVYELHHRYYAQAVGSSLLLGLIAYALFFTIHRGLTKPETPPARRILGWTEPHSVATIVLLVLCIVGTLVGWMISKPWYAEEGTVGWSGVWVHHEWWRLATSPFLHANSAHLYFNMIALWVLGRQLDATLGTPRFLAVYFGAALGGGLAVVAVHQEHTLGASGAIYGLMGAVLCFGVHAFRAGHRNAAKRMLLAVGVLIGINLLFSFSFPSISMAAHVGGLISGFLIVMLVGFPAQMNEAWALSDRLPSGAFTYDVNAQRFSYHGPAGFALESGLVEPDAVAVTKKSGWSTHLNVKDLDPATTIETYVDDPSGVLQG